MCLQSISEYLSFFSCWLEHSGGGGVELKSWLRYLCFFTIFSKRPLWLAGRRCSVNRAVEYILFVIILLFLGLFLEVSTVKFVNPSSEAIVSAFAEWGLIRTPQSQPKFRECYFSDSMEIEINFSMRALHLRRCYLSLPSFIYIIIWFKVKYLKLNVAQWQRICLPVPETKRDGGSIAWSGRSPGVGNGNPLQYSCLQVSWTGAW